MKAIWIQQRYLRKKMCVHMHAHKHPDTRDEIFLKCVIMTRGK